MAFENKKQVLTIAGAVLAGIVAVVLTSNYIKSSIEGQTAALAQQYNIKQKEMVAAIQQRSDQQMAALAQELEKTKQEQAQALQKQIAALQASQAEESRKAAASEQAAQAMARVPKKVRQPSLALKTPKDKRAVTVMIDSLAAVGGLINAGDYVDVIAQLNFPSNGRSKKTLTTVLFQNLEVLAINTNLDDPGAYEEQQAAASLKITFAVGPQEAGLLAFASKNGTLELALRSNAESKKHVKLKADTWKTLAEYVLKHDGINLENPDGNQMKALQEKPDIQIFRGGKEL